MSAPTPPTFGTDSPPQLPSPPLSAPTLLLDYLRYRNPSLARSLPPPGSNSSLRLPSNTDTFFWPGRSGPPPGTDSPSLPFPRPRLLLAPSLRHLALLPVWPRTASPQGLLAPDAGPPLSQLFTASLWLLAPSFRLVLIGRMKGEEGLVEDVDRNYEKHNDHFRNDNHQAFATASIYK